MLLPKLKVVPLFLFSILLATILLLAVFVFPGTSKSDCLPGLSQISGEGLSFAPNYIDSSNSGKGTVGKNLNALVYCFNYSEEVVAYFGNTPISSYQKGPQASNNDSLIFTVPNIPDGAYTFKIKNGNNFTQSFNLRVFQEPIPSSISPSTISSATTVIVKGSNFGSSGKIELLLACYEAKWIIPDIVSWSNTEIKFKITADQINKFYSTRGGVCKYNSASAKINYFNILIHHLYSSDTNAERSTSTKPLYLYLGASTTSSTNQTTNSVPTIPKNVTLPSIFSLEGSQTTPLVENALDNLENLTFEVVNKNKIQFTDSVSLTPDKDKLENLDQFVNLNTIGKVEVITKQLGALANKAAVVTMKNIPFLSLPKIFVDGQDSSNVVSEINFDQKNKTITFKVGHFSVFLLVPSISINEPKNNTTTFNSGIKVTGNTNDPTGKIEVAVNDKNQATISADTKGNFETKVTLDTINNSVTAKVISTNSASSSATVKVSYINLFYPIGFISTTGLAVFLIYFLIHSKKLKSLSSNDSTT